MARYSAFLGRRVEVHYRAGDILLPASGTFVADSGRSIFLEQHLEQHGQMKQFRWEIPYQYIVRLEDRSEPSEASGIGNVRSPAASGWESDRESGQERYMAAQSPARGRWSEEMHRPLR